MLAAEYSHALSPAARRHSLRMRQVSVQHPRRDVQERAHLASRRPSCLTAMTIPGASTASPSSSPTTRIVIRIRARTSARTDASRRSSSLPMKARSIRKICGRCGRGFDIPYVRASIARELMLMYYPCPHCLETQEPPGNLIELTIKRRPGPTPAAPSARCRRCCVPFVLKRHHARGYCMRCYRAKNGYA